MSKKDSAADTAGMLFVAFLTFVAIIPAILWSTFVAKVLYGWFVIEPFGAPDVNFWTVAGLVMSIGWLTKYVNFNCSDRPVVEKAQESLAKVFYAFVAPTFALGFGWVYHMLATQ